MDEDTAGVGPVDASDATVLLDLEGLAVRAVQRAPDGERVVHLETAEETAAACPVCGVLAWRVKGYVRTGPRDLPCGGGGLQLVWRKRRWHCDQPGCPRASFTESVPAVPARARLTTRLRAHAGNLVVDGICATVSAAGRATGLSWPTAMDAARNQRRYSTRSTHLGTIASDRTEDHHMPALGPLHHLELWVPNLVRAEASWGWLLTTLGATPFQSWEHGRSWRWTEDGVYVVLEQSPALTGDRHDRCAPGLNHLALWAGTSAELDALVAAAPDHGWTLMFPEQHPFAGGSEHRAAYLADADGYEVELVASKADDSGRS